MARTLIEELLVGLGVQVDEQGFRKAIRSYTDLRFAAMDVVNAARRVGEALLSPIIDTVKLGNETSLTAARLGIGAEKLQAYRMAADLAGVSSEALTSGIEKLGRSAFAASTHATGEQAKAFARLGVSIYGANGRLKQSDALFDEAADKLSRLSNSAERAGLTFLLMGRGAGQLLPLIAQGPGYFAALTKEIRDTGAVMDEGAIEATRQLSFWFKVLTLHGDGLQRRFAQGMVPILFRLTGTVLSLVKANKDMLNQGVDKAVEVLTKGLYLLLHAAVGVWDVVRNLVDAFGGWKNVLLVVAGVVSFGLAAALGQVTLAMLKFAATLALAGIGPAIFGVMAALIALIYQDLTSANSLIKQILDEGERPDDTPLIVFLRTAGYAALALRDALKEVAGFTAFVGLKAYRTIKPVLDFEPPDAKRELLRTYLDAAQTFSGGNFFRRAPALEGGGYGTSTATATVNVTQHFHGPTDARAQKEAADDAFRSAVDPVLQRALEQNATKNAVGRSGPQ